MAKPIESICLALPAYNEEARIEELIRVAARVLVATGLGWRIVVVDDGSKDSTAAIVQDLATAIPELLLARHERNRGLGPAIITCLKKGLAARPVSTATDRHMVVCMDADLTHPPETIPLMIEKMNGGADIVIASRFQPASRQVGVPFNRQLMSLGARMLFRHYLNLPGVRDYTCGFRAMRGSLLTEGFARYGEEGLITRSGFACTDELLVHLALLGPKIEEVPFTLRYDLKIGESKMKLGLTIWETLKLLRTHRSLLRRPGPHRPGN